MKKIKINIEDLFELTNSEIFNPDSFKASSCVALDSRKVKKNSIFFAIKGSNFDGHNFLKQAVENGASTVVVNREKIGELDWLDSTIIAVDDTIAAYGELAAIWRKKLKAKTIAITGSSGKTTTKEILAQLLKYKYKTVKTEANNNNHIGAPLTIFQADEKTERLVLELGTNHFGEIAYTAKIANPDLAIITNIGSSHLEYLKSLQGVAKEKLSLFKETVKSNGLILINKDDKIIAKKTAGYKNRKSFSLEKKADIFGRIIEFDQMGFPIVELNASGKKEIVKLPLFGRAGAKNFIAAVAAALQCGMNLREIKQAASKIKAAEKRTKLVKLKNLILIDDSYNANPESMKSSLEALGLIKKYERKIAILGDMFELGEKANKFHKELAKEVLKNKITEAALIGEKMKELYEALRNRINVFHFNSRDEMKNFILNHSFENSAVLIKGSRGMKMEEFIKYVIKIG